MAESIGGKPENARARFGRQALKCIADGRQGLHLIVLDIEAARAELADRGVDVSEVQHFESGGMVPGPDPEGRDYGSYVFFSDPDGNSWAVQQVRRGEPGA